MKPELANILKPLVCLSSEHHLPKEPKPQHRNPYKRLTKLFKNLLVYLETSDALMRS